MTKKRNARKGANNSQQARLRSLQLRYPFYTPCTQAEAERELGVDRAAELLALHDGSLQRADIELDKLLTSGTFTMVEIRFPEGRTWTMADYIVDWNNDLAAEAARDDSEYGPITEDQLIETLHQWHRSGAVTLNRDLVIEWASSS
ncbi:hypothetical protein P3T36_006326 [Kitasatospora sp. MAP12-15]|uniref:hypothetical protein n=1 Tax=unclassified Kitasatospora TaxID=2633591 RepID=UPI0024747B26|nr:hypothetical protein [Kitasatospora sp. MAP12-44]MDH6107867.1 hypothetical protein [Kitasatospora sp. MAP12-44]